MRSLPSIKRALSHFEFIGYQLLQQGIQFTAGILLLRFLSKADYGVYFLAVSMVSVVSIASSSGLDTGFNRIAGVLTKDKTRFSAATASLARVRRLAVLVVSVLFAGPLVWFLQRQGLEPLYAYTLAALVLLLAYVQAVKALLTAPLRLLGQFIFLGRLGVVGNVLTLGTTLGIVYFFPTPIVVIIASMGVALVGIGLAYRKLSPCLERGQKADPAMVKDLRSYYFQLLPNSCFYTVQGNIGTFLLATFGNVTAVAGLGAISRFGRITQLFDAYTQNVIVPKFAQAPHRAEWIKQMKRFGSLYVICALGLFGALVILTPAFLFLLGPEYTHLTFEFRLFAVGMMLNFIIGFIVKINSAKGWIYWSARLQIAGSILGMALGAWLFDVSVLVGVLLFGIATRIPVLGIQLMDLYRGFRAFSPAL